MIVLAQGLGVLLARREHRLVAADVVGDAGLGEVDGEAVEQLAKVAEDAGLSMIELAIAFVINHQAVTSAIIGPRTMEQLESQLPAADATLDAAALDRIDEIIRPGVNLNPADTSYGEQVLESTLRRRD